VVRQELVELGPRHHQAEVRERLEVRPRELERHAPRADPQPLVPLEPRVVGVDAQAPKLDDRTRREAVAADLLPGERGLLDHEHVQAVAGEVVRRGGASRSRADDQGVDVKLLARRARH
jgi:hypothetical protein